MDRQEHLAWAKGRALEYASDPGTAMASLMQDFAQHPDLKDHSALELMTMLVFTGNLRPGADTRRFIEGFN